MDVVIINTELNTYQKQLPTKLEELAEFLLVAPEKAKALRAEIKAIEKLHLAQEVYDQKMEEQRILAELILDASVKVGELTKMLPKAQPGPRGELRDSNVPYLPKSEAVKDLGFSKKQVQRFEKLSDNADLVEQVKSEAKESNTIPTRTKVLDLAKERDKRYKQDIVQIDKDYDNLERFRKATSYSSLLEIDDEILNSVVKADDDLAVTIEELTQLIQALTLIKNKLITRGGNSNAKTERN